MNSNITRFLHIILVSKVRNCDVYRNSYFLSKILQKKSKSQKTAFYRGHFSHCGLRVSQGFCTLFWCQKFEIVMYMEINNFCQKFYKKILTKSKFFKYMWVLNSNIIRFLHIILVSKVRNCDVYGN